MGRPRKTQELLSIVSFRLPRSMVAALDELAAGALRDTGETHTRGDVVRQFLEDGIRGRAREKTTREVLAELTTAAGAQSVTGLRDALLAFVKKRRTVNGDALMGVFQEAGARAEEINAALRVLVSEGRVFSRFESSGFVVSVKRAENLRGKTGNEWRAERRARKRERAVGARK